MCDVTVIAKCLHLCMSSCVCVYLSVCLYLAEPSAEPVAPAGDGEPPTADEETVVVEESEIDHLSDVVCCCLSISVFL